MRGMRGRRALTGKEACGYLRDGLGRIAVDVPQRARWRLENGRGESKNVHFRPLFPDGHVGALSLDAVGKSMKRQEHRKDDGKRVLRGIARIHATIQEGYDISES